MWDRWQRGDSLNEIGRAFDRPSSSIFGQISATGVIRPPPRKRSTIALTLSERYESFIATKFPQRNGFIATLTSNVE